MKTFASIDQLVPGDLVGYTGNCRLSWLVNLATYGTPWLGISHVGIVGEYNSERLLFESTESTTELPCAITGKPFRGTQAFRIGARLADYQGKVWRYPLYRPLYDFERLRLNKFLLDTLHTPYDQMGAFRSAGVGLSWVESLFRDQDLTTIFCSEMVAAAYSVVGLFASDNVSRWNPNRLVRRLRWHEILLKPRRLK